MTSEKKAIASLVIENQIFPLLKKRRANAYINGEAQYKKM